MAERRSYSTGTTWEDRVGYSRAVRVGSYIHVSGTLGATAEGEPAGDAYGQAIAAFDRIRGALEALGSSFEDVVRTRMFVVDIDRNHEPVGRAHGELLGTVRPASTMVGISALIGPGFLVEIEVDAQLPG